MSSSLFVDCVLCTHQDLRFFPTRRSSDLEPPGDDHRERGGWELGLIAVDVWTGDGEEHDAVCERSGHAADDGVGARSEEHTSELQSLRHLVCRLLLEKNNVKRGGYEWECV